MTAIKKPMTHKIQRVQNATDADILFFPRHDTGWNQLRAATCRLHHEAERQVGSVAEFSKVAASLTTEIAEFNGSLKRYDALLTEAQSKVKQLSSRADRLRRLMDNTPPSR